MVIRIAINFILIGYQEISFTQSGNIVTINHPLIHTNHNFREISLIFTDLLLMLGAGMLFGRYIRIMQYKTNSKNNTI